MTVKKSTTKKVKIFSWEFVKSPQGHRLLLIIAVAGFVLFYILHVKPVKDALEVENRYLKKDSELKDSIISTNNTYINVLTSSNSSLRRAVDQADHKIITIHEKTQDRIDRFDTASITDMQRFFKDRYTTP